MKKLTMLDTRADDDRQGEVHGAVTPRLCEYEGHLVPGASSSTLALTPQGGGMSISSMQRFCIAGSYGYCGTGPSSFHVITPYAAVQSHAYQAGGFAPRAKSVSSGLLGSAVAAGDAIGGLIGMPHFDSAENAPYLSVGFGSRGDVHLKYQGATAIPIFTVTGICQDGYRTTVGEGAGSSGFGEVTIPLTGEELYRFASVYVTCDTEITPTTLVATFSPGDTNRSDLQCTLSIDGTKTNDSVTFVATTLVVGSPAEGGIATGSYDEGIDLDAIAADYMAKPSPVAD